MRSVAEALDRDCGVQGVHELTSGQLFWRVALSAHVVLQPEAEGCVVLEQMQRCLVSVLALATPTIQFEGEPCEQLDCACGGGI